MRAAELYDPEKGHFSNYATQWIRQGIRRYLENHRRTICLPAYLWEVFERAIRAMAAEQNRAGETLSTDQKIETIAEVIQANSKAAQEKNKNKKNVQYGWFNRDLSDYSEARSVAAETILPLLGVYDDPLSLSDPHDSDPRHFIPFADVAPDEEPALADVMRDEEMNPEQAASAAEQADHIQHILSQVIKMPRQKDIIRMRLGLPPYQREYTQEEIADKYDVARQSISWIETKALRILRQPDHRDYLANITTRQTPAETRKIMETAITHGIVPATPPAP